MPEYDQPQVPPLGEPETFTEIDLVGAASGSIVLTSKVVGDADKRFKMAADGSMSWGDGTNPVDVSISRSVGASSGMLTMTGDGTTRVAFVLNNPAGTSRDIQVKSGGVLRWLYRVNLTAESGGNVGSDVQWLSRDDSGAALRTDLFLIRSSGVWSFGGQLNPNTDNSFDLGGTSNRWRSIYAATSFIAGGNAGGSSAYVQVNGAAATNRDIAWYTAGVQRWILRTDNSTESGGNAGSDFYLNARDDSGVSLYQAFKITRPTGVINLGGPLIWGTDNTNDVGASGATRPRNVYAGTSFTLATTGQLAWSTDLFLRRGAAQNLSQSNGVNAQSYTIYNTTDSDTSPVNYERLIIRWSSNIAAIFQQTGGTGVTRTLAFGVGNGTQWVISTGGHWTANTDNAVDIGASAATRPRSIYWGTQAIGPDGTLSNPAYAFASDITRGFYLVTAANKGFGFVMNGAEKIRLCDGSFSDYGMVLIAAGHIAWNSTTLAQASNPTPDLILRRGAAGTVSQSNGANAQVYRLYNTTDSDSAPVNYERTFFGYSGNILYLGSAAGGTGTYRALRIQTNNSDRWEFNVSGGHLFAVTDNTNDIGASGATRPRSLYLGTQLAIGTNPATVGDIRLANASAIEARNAANSANAQLIGLDASNNIGIGDANSNNIVFTAPGQVTMSPASLVEIKNGGAAMELRVFGTTTGTKYLSLKHDGTSCLITQQAGLGQIAFGTAAKATADTAGYLCIPSCAGAPTGVPASIPTGQIPFQIDSTNKKLYAYIGGAWTKLQVTAVDAIFG